MTEEKIIREAIREAWLKDQKDEILSPEEVRDLVRALEHEGALKEIERRRELIEAENELAETQKLNNELIIAEFKKKALKSGILTEGEIDALIEALNSKEALEALKG